MPVHRKSAILTLSVMFFIALLLSTKEASAIPGNMPAPDTIDTHPGAGPESPLLPTRRFKEIDTGVGIGIWQGNLSTSSVSETDEYLRYTMTIYDSATFAHEYNFSLTSNSLLGWTGGFKKLLGLGENNEPFVAVHAGALYQPSESFGTLINWQRYQIVGEVGAEDLFKMHRRLRAQMGVSWSALGVGEYLGLTYMLP